MFHDIIYRLRRIAQQRAVILMYHQVCDRKDDPWELAVHPDHFQTQLEYLKKNFEVLPIADLVDGVSRRKVKRAISITFDDGFRDNYTNAAPLLDWLDLPATFYVTTTAIQDQGAYWWDALQHIVFHTEVLPPRLEFSINGETVDFAFRSHRILTSRIVNQIRAWNYQLPIPNERVSLYMLLWQKIQQLPYAYQHAVIGELQEWAGGAGSSAQSCVTMSVREMQILGHNPLFSIGAHSVHHAMLSQQSDAEQAYEVSESKRLIEQWLGKPVNGFAYPYGSYTAATQQILRDAGFRYAVSTQSKPVTGDDDPFALPRIQVKNWCVYEFASKINEMFHE